MQTTLRIDDDIFREAKAEAARAGVTLTKFIEDALLGHIAVRSKPVNSLEAEIAERDRLMEGLLKSTAHFRIGPHPTREEMNAR